MSQHIDPPMMQASVVDNLTTNDGTKALSAKQGKALNDGLSALNSKIADVRDYIEIGNISSKSGLDYWMSRLITDSSLQNGKKLARFACTATFTPFVIGVSYFIDLSASSENYASAIIQGIGYAQLIQATKIPSGWSYELIAVDSKIELTTVVKAELQVVPSNNRFLIWLYDSYVSLSNYHAYRIDFNGNAKTAKLESITSGSAPTTLLTFNVT